MKRLLWGSLLILFVIVVGVIVWQTRNMHLSRTLPSNQQLGVPVNNNTTSAHTALDHIVIITMENKAYDDIVASAQAPYINTLIHTYSFAANYSAVSHPSLPNYIALIGGSTFDITSDCTDCYINATNLIDQLDQSHKTWKAYMESMPNPCFSGNASPYAQKHNPFLYFDDIRNNPSRCNNIVPYTQLHSDLSSEQTTPNYLWISPNLCNDMHNCSVATGDEWLATQVPLILNSKAFTKQKSLLVITWDESEGIGPNKVPTILIGNSVKHGYVSQRTYSHYSLLHTIETMWNLSPLTVNVSQAPVLSEFIKH